MLQRMVDANINRVAEGIRVLEDIARFTYNHKELTEALRRERHRVRKTLVDTSFISYREASKDVGYEISANSRLDSKESLRQLVDGNFKRVQEGLRVIEEALKVMGYYEAAKTYEAIRYCFYQLENEFPKKKPLDTDIYGILGEEFSKGRKNVDVVKAFIAAGIKIIQYREKEKEKGEKYRECLEIRKLTEGEATFIINDDVDVALAVKADGVHIGQRDMPLEEVKKIAGHMLIGVSTHNPQQAKEAVDLGADYIGVGPIFSTTTKKNVEKSEGLHYLKWVSENINLPYVAIGGINASNVGKVKEHGGKTFAMISELVGAEDIVKKVHQIRSLIR